MARKKKPSKDRYDRIALPAPLTRQVIAAAALKNLTLIRYVDHRLSPIADAVITLNTASSHSAKAKAEVLLKETPRGAYEGAQGAKPRAIMFYPEVYGDIALAAKLEGIQPYEFLHRYLVPLAKQDLVESLKRLLEEPA